MKITKSKLLIVGFVALIVLSVVSLTSGYFKFKNDDPDYNLYRKGLSFKLSGKTRPSKKITLFDPRSLEWFDPKDAVPAREKYIESNKDGYYETYLKPGVYSIGFEDNNYSCDFVSGSDQPDIKVCQISVTDKDLVINIKPVVK